MTSNFLKLFDALLEPTFAIDATGIVIYCNEAGATLCDLSPKKVLRMKKKLDELFLFEGGQLEALGTLATVTDSTPYQELRYKTLSEKEGRAQFTVQRLDDTATEWIVFLRDVTLEETLQKKYRHELEQKEDVILDLQKARAALEDYSKNLETMVAQRTKELSALNGKMQALLDSLNEGFFIFGEDGKCMDVSSKACERILEQNPNHKIFWEVLKLGDHEVNGVKKWLQTCFMEMLPFEDLAPLGPKKFKHHEGLDIELSYFPLRTPEGTMQGIVCVASDITELVAARTRAETERAYVTMILNLMKNRKQIRTFVTEADSLIAQIKHETSKPELDGDALFRHLHTLKGSAGIYSLKDLIEACHHGESLLSQFRRLKTPEARASIDENASKLPGIFDSFKSVTLKEIGFDPSAEAEVVEVPRPALEKFHNELTAKAPSMAAPFEENFLYEPIASSFEHLSETLFAVAESIGKKVLPLTFDGGDLRVAKEPYRVLFESFIHAFRNSIDHGIETPEERLAAGKPEAGAIRLMFKRMDDRLGIMIRDDGRGISAERLRAKLTEKGVDVSQETDEQVIQHVFDASFSTRDEVTELSGRGVGMDAIAAAVKALGGSYRVRTTMGKETRVEISVPWLTRAPGLKAA